MCVIHPSKIKNNLHDWRNPYDLEFFIDFETINEHLINFEGVSELVFLFGLGYTYLNQWYYRSFVVNELTLKEELKTFYSFIDFIYKLIDSYKMITKKTKPTIRITHYSDAEIRHMKRLSDNMYERLSLSTNISDLYQIILKEPIVIKDSFDFGLKSIVNALKKHNKIDIDYSMYKVNDGKKAMMSAITGDNNLMQESIRYNELDCKSLYEILKYFRLNH